MRAFRLTSLMGLLLFAPAVICPAATKAKAEQTPIPDLTAAQVIFQDHCALCHGLDGGGGRGPDLRHPKLAHAPDDDALKLLIENGIPPEMPDAWYLSKDEIAGVAAFVRSLGRVPKETLPGDGKRGEALYRRSGCAGCHILSGEGVGFGPDLTEIGSRRGAARLRAILRTPAKTIPDGFLLVEIVKLDGETVRGIRLNEDSFTIQLKDPQNHIYSFRKSELRVLNKMRGQTPMPAYDAQFSPTDMDDIVAFLASQRGQP